MNILVTGCAGLLGSNFCDWVIKNKSGIRIVGIDNLSGGYLENVGDINFINMDLMEYDNIEKIFDKYNFSYVYHFAAYAAEGLSPFIRKFNYNDNLLVTTNIVNCCIKYNVKRLIFTSSMATYGNGDGNLPFSEETIQKPIDPYGVAKFAAEMDIKIASEQHGLDYCIIRPHNVYGLKQNIWDKYRNVLGIWMYQLINDQPITIYGDGKQSRAFSYIDDILEPLWNAAILEKSKNQEINLGGSRSINLNDASDILLDVAGKGEKVYLEQRHEVKHAWCTVDKSIKLLNYNEKTNLKEGLQKMWNWAIKQPNRERKEWKNFELEKNIYSHWKLN
jgi:UDP-glucose 4-epimerase